MPFAKKASNFSGAKVREKPGKNVDEMSPKSQKKDHSKLKTTEAEVQKSFIFWNGQYPY
jgi:hypothetical protein